jgi:hypothetical protein
MAYRRRRRNKRPALEKWRHGSIESGACCGVIGVSGLRQRRRSGASGGGVAAAIHQRGGGSEKSVAWRGGVVAIKPSASARWRIERKYSSRKQRESVWRPGVIK